MKNSLRSICLLAAAWLCCAPTGQAADKLSTPSPSLDGPTAMNVTNKPRAAAVDANFDPTADWMRRIVLSWLPPLREGTIPLVRSPVSDPFENNKAIQSKRQPPEPPVPFLPFDLPTKPSF